MRFYKFLDKPTSSVYTRASITNHQFLAGYIPFDEGVGSNANDITLAKSVGLISGGAQWVDGLYAKV